MRAVVVNAFGDAGVLRIEDVPEPEPGPGQVAVRVAAAGLNFSDLLQREGRYPGGPTPPFVAGVEGAGRVVAVGSEVADAPAIGTPVAFLGRGAHAEVAVADARVCVPLPGAGTAAEGAAFSVSFQTAYHALVTQARAEPGETVLVHAAGGGLGTAAVQLAGLLGLRVVAATSTPAKRERVRQLGADVVVGYDELDGVVRGERRNRPDLVLASVGGRVFRRTLALSPPLSRVVIVGFAGEVPEAIDPTRLVFRSHSVHGLHLEQVLRRPDLARAGLARLLAWWESGALRPQVGHQLELSQAASAHELMASRDSYGKIVLSL